VRLDVSQLVKLLVALVQGKGLDPEFLHLQRLYAQRPFGDGVRPGDRCRNEGWFRFSLFCDYRDFSLVVTYDAAGCSSVSGTAIGGIE